MTGKWSDSFVLFMIYDHKNISFFKKKKPTKNHDNGSKGEVPFLWRPFMWATTCHMYVCVVAVNLKEADILTLIVIQGFRFQNCGQDIFRKRPKYTFYAKPQLTYWTIAIKLYNK